MGKNSIHYSLHSLGDAPADQAEKKDWGSLIPGFGGFEITAKQLVAFLTGQYSYSPPRMDENSLLGRLVDPLADIRDVPHFPVVKMEIPKPTKIQIDLGQKPTRPKPTVIPEDFRDLFYDNMGVRPDKLQPGVVVACRFAKPPRTTVLQ